MAGETANLSAGARVVDAPTLEFLAGYRFDR